MINYETILSAFDDKETLLLWLQKVEKALAESTLTSVECVNVNENYIKFTFNFEDGTKIITPQVYVKPGVDGTDGQDGTDGKDGIGFNTLSEVVIPSTVASVLYSAASGATVTGNAEFKTGDGNFSVPVKNVIPISGAGAVSVNANGSAKKIEISLAGYAGASSGTYPRKGSSGLEWVSGTGGGATVETGTFTAPLFQAGVGSTSGSWSQLVDKSVSCYYSFIGDLLTVCIPQNTVFAAIDASKTVYVSLAPLMGTFNIPLTARNIYLGGQVSLAGAAVAAYPFTYVEDGVMFAIQFQKTIAFGTSTNAYVTTNSTMFQCPPLCFTINGVTKK